MFCKILAHLSKDIKCTVEPTPLSLFLTLSMLVPPTHTRAADTDTELNYKSSRVEKSATRQHDE